MYQIHAMHDYEHVYFISETQSELSIFIKDLTDHNVLILDIEYTDAYPELTYAQMAYSRCLLDTMYTPALGVH